MPEERRPSGLFPPIWLYDYSLIMTKIEQGADVYARDADGRNALMLASIHGMPACLTVLLALGFNSKINDKDFFGMTALLHAVDSDNQECAEMLLNAGADPNIEDDMHYTPLIRAGELYACSQSVEEMRQLLIQHGADPNYLDRRSILRENLPAYMQGDLQFAMVRDETPQSNPSGTPQEGSPNRSDESFAPSAPFGF